MLRLLSDVSSAKNAVEKTISRIADQPFDALGVFEMLGVPLGSIVAHRLGKRLVIFRQKSQEHIAGKQDRFSYASFQDYNEQKKQFRLLKDSVADIQAITLFDDYLDIGAQCEAALEICSAARIRIVQALFWNGSTTKLSDLQNKYPETRFGIIN
jgi:adenine/guanine phosphoribosyltransferase-like PRPP-binding protein